MWNLICGTSLAVAMLGVTVNDDTPPKSKPSVSVEFCGRLRHGMMAIGGESTGTTISFNRTIWEVQLHSDADREFARQHHKKTVVVTGSLRKVSGIETKDRWIIDVTKLTEQDATKTREGVRMAIIGNLRTVAARNGRAASMAIVSGRQVWPIDLSMNSKLKIAAESSVGQRILLTGTLKPTTDQTSKSQPVIKVTTMKQPPPEPVK